MSNFLAFKSFIVKRGIFRVAGLLRLVMGLASDGGFGEFCGGFPMAFGSLCFFFFFFLVVLVAAVSCVCCCWWWWW